MLTISWMMAPKKIARTSRSVRYFRRPERRRMALEAAKAIKDYKVSTIINVRGKKMYMQDAYFAGHQLHEHDYGL